MDTWLIWALVLFVAGLLITAAEVILPSAGMLAFVAFVCLVGSLVCAYQLSGMAALALLVIEGVCVPLVIVGAFKLLPKTSLGRQLILSPPEEKTGGKPAATTASSGTVSRYDLLLHKEGVVVAALRPSGTAEFDGARISVISDGQLIPEGSRIRVVLVEGARVVVEPLTT
jgi:membrane-bound serine protease (ClpP class)